MMDLAHVMAEGSRGKTYGRVAFSGGRWVLSDVPPYVAIKLKAIFPAIPKTRVGSFEFPHSPPICTDLEWFLDRYPMTISAPDAQMLINGRFRFERDQNEIASILSHDWKPSGRVALKPGKKLYPNQEKAVELVDRLKRLLLMDDLGLGKTVTALGVLLKTNALPAAIIVQAHLPSQWVEEFIKPFTNLTVHVIQGRQPYTLPPADIYLFRYTNIAGWVDIAATGLFRAVICDEMQELRHGTDTEKGKAAEVFFRMAEIRMGLTATPVFNYASEIFKIMNLIEPGCLGDWWEFVREWCVSKGTKWLVRDPDALGTYLRDMNLTLRRERGGRPVNSISVEVDYDEKVERDAADLTRTLAQKVLSGSFAERGQASRELDMFARMITGVAKAKSVAAYVRMLLKAGGGPIILAGWHRDVYAIWAEELAEFSPVFYTGTESTRQKDRAKAAFISGKTDLLVISLRSGAGLDGLQHRCSTVVVGELDWSPKVHEQLIGRVDRPGQPAEQVTAIYLYTNSGSDPVMIELAGIKASQGRGITDPMKGAVEVFSDESRIRLLAERYLASAGAAR